MRTALKVLLTLVVIAAIGGYGAYHYWQTRLQAPITLDEPMLYEVPPGAGFNRVVDDLEAQGVLADAWAFKLLTRVEPDRVPSLKVGEYSLEPGMSGMQVLDKLASAEVVTYSVTIPEGWTFQQMRAALAEAEKLAHASAEMSDDEIMTALGHEGEHL